MGSSVNIVAPSTIGVSFECEGKLGLWRDNIVNLGLRPPRRCPGLELAIDGRGLPPYLRVGRSKGLLQAGPKSLWLPINAPHQVHVRWLTASKTIWLQLQADSVMSPGK